MIYRREPRYMDPPGTLRWSVWDPTNNTFHSFLEEELVLANDKQRAKIRQAAMSSQQALRDLNPRPGMCLEVKEPKAFTFQGWFTIRMLLKPGEVLVCDPSDLEYTDVAFGDDSLVDEDIQMGIPKWEQWTPASMWVYSPRHRRQFRVHPEDVIPHNFNRQALNNVVLPSGYEQKILDVIHDVAEGNRDPGVNLLFFGPPGCGKTYTANLLAEHTGRAILYVDGRDLMESPDSFERTIGEALKKASAWRAILLFDEADVMLRDRELSGGTATHTAALLRLLEGHSGIVAMTSNRAFEIDSAFASRIHLALPYPALDAPARVKVWDQLLKKQGLAYKSEELQGLGGYEVDGRGINLCILNATSAANNRDGIITLDDLHSMAAQRMEGIEQLRLNPSARRTIRPPLQVEYLSWDT